MQLTMQNVAPGTAVTVAINSHYGTGCLSPPTFIGTITFACDTGAVLAISNKVGEPAVIPSGSTWSLLLLIGLLAATVVIRRRRATRT